MRKLFRVVFVGAFAAVSIGLTAGSAQADTDCQPATDDPGGVSCWIMHMSGSIVLDDVEFWANGERLIVADLRCNGQGVVAYVNGERYPNTRGCYETREFDLGFAEGRKIQLSSCKTDDGAEFACEGATATA